MTKIKINKKLILYSIGQAVLIVIGVSVATWFDNMNENRKERKFEKVLLYEMAQNLDSDLAWIKQEMSALGEGIDASRKILELLELPELKSDSLNFYMVDVMWYSTTAFNTASYETIKSKGLDMITNDSLRQYITFYYEVRMNDLKDQLRIGYNLGWDFYAPQLMTKFKSFSVKNGTVPRDLKALQKDEDYKQLLNIIIEMKTVQLKAFKRSNRTAQSLKQEVQTEYEKL